MPNVQEVYEMVTKQKQPEPGALERQHTRQVRTARNRKIGALVVAAAICAATIIAIMLTRPSDDPRIPASTTTVNPAAAEKVVRDFLAAFGSFDAETASTYVAEGADMTRLTNGYTDANSLSMITSYLQAQGYRQTITSCDTFPGGTGVRVDCAFDFHAIRSAEIGRGPFTGSTFSFVVEDGKITWGAQNWNTEKFSPQMWEPFAEWVSTTYPKDAAAMYTDGTLSDFQLTATSIRLWGERTREWVKVVNGNQGA